VRLLTLVARNLRHHRRAHAATAAGAAVATAVLSGALIVGDSVRESLRDLVLRRLGRTEFAIESGDRRFRPELADRMKQITGRNAAALLAVQASASAPDRGTGLPRIDVYGIDGAFDAFGPEASRFGDLAEDEAIANEVLALKLGLRRGDALVIRPEAAIALPADVPLGSAADTVKGLRLTVRAIARDDALGAFSLRAQQVPSPSLFVRRDDLGSAVGAENRANVLLLAGTSAPAIEPRQALREAATMADYGLEVRRLPEASSVEVRSERVFIEDSTADAALSAGAGARGVLSYFVNEIRAGEAACPYSMVAATGTVGPSDLADDEIVVNEWLAGDLGAVTGATVSLTYYVPGPSPRLEEQTRSFRVRTIVKIAGPAADRELMPSFPGLREATRCGDWKPGIPLELSRIRPKDEAYWEQYRGTPKAFVTLRTARDMWANRFGSLTAIRYPGTINTDQLERAILAALPPEQAGLVIRPVREEGLRAAAGGVDFGGLFIGLSFFILASAVLLTALLFSLSAESRAEETGLLRAIGFSPGRVRLVLLAEGAAVAAAGGLLGSVAGLGYTSITLSALRTVWHGAVGTSALAMHPSPAALIAAFATGLLTAIVSMRLVLRKHGCRTIRHLQATEVMPEPSILAARARRRVMVGLPLLCLAGLTLAAPVAAGERLAAALFFPAGALALAGGILLVAARLASASRTTGDSRGGFVFGIRSWARRPRRALAAVAMPACGVFLVLAVGLHRPEIDADAERRSSGTGGFDVYAETARPITRAPPRNAGETWYGLSGVSMENTEVVLLRLRSGDDASCLNLNRVERPPLLGAPVETFRRDGRFSFARVDPQADRADPWNALSLDLGPGVIPAVADQSVITWGLAKSVGDRIDYIDERGRPVQLQLVGALKDSIFQGRLLISEPAMLRHFPSTGFRVVLADAPPGRGAALREELQKGLLDLGIDATPAVDRLAAFTVVQRTYLDIFLALGGLGLIVGTAGFGVVAARNILERRGEFGILLALGYRRSSVTRSTLLEHALMVLAGALIGAAAAALASGRTASGDAGGIPPVAAMLVAFVSAGVLSAWAGVKASLRGPILTALRDE
jgi:putative ABC transport system permease protein